MCTDLEVRHKTVFVYRHHDYLCREPERIKKTFGTNDELLQVHMIQGKYAKANCFPVYQQ